MRYRHAVFARFRDGATATAAAETLRGARLGEQLRVYECDETRTTHVISQNFLTSSTRPESDARRGMRLGLIIGSLLGAGMGATLFHLLEMQVQVGILMGVVMGSFIGALMSGIVGAGLLNPGLKRVIQNTLQGEAVLSVSLHTRDEQARAEQLLGGEAIELARSK